MVTQEQIKETAKIIADTVQPEKIYLFESYAKGIAIKESDIDFLVIMPDKTKKKYEVAEEIDKEIKNILPAYQDVIVDYADKFKKYHSIPYSFIGHIVSTGIYYMSPEKKDIILSWYEKADEDILTAEIIIEANLILYDISAFHSQQAAEKYIKASLVFINIAHCKRCKRLCHKQNWNLKFCRIKTYGNRKRNTRHHKYYCTNCASAKSLSFWKLCKWQTN